MRGAIIFLIAFLVFLVVTLGYPALPPGRAIYDALVGAETDYEVVGIPATTLIMATINQTVSSILFRLKLLFKVNGPLWFLNDPVSKILICFKPFTKKDFIRCGNFYKPGGVD